eukprot:1270724-Heterocapsa_arctica.AAC.1
MAVAFAREVISLVPPGFGDEAAAPPLQRQSPASGDPHRLARKAAEALAPNITTSAAQAVNQGGAPTGSDACRWILALANSEDIK